MLNANDIEALERAICQHADALVDGLQTASRKQRGWLKAQLRAFKPEGRKNLEGLLGKWLERNIEHMEIMGRARELISDGLTWEETRADLLRKYRDATTVLFGVGAAVLCRHHIEERSAATNGRARVHMAPLVMAGNAPSSPTEPLSPPWSGFLAALDQIGPNDKAWDQMGNFTIQVQAMHQRKRREHREARAASIATIVERAPLLRFLGRDDLVDALQGIKADAVPESADGLVIRLGQALGWHEAATESEKQASTRMARDQARAGVVAIEQQIDAVAQPLAAVLSAKAAKAAPPASAPIGPPSVGAKAERAGESIRITPATVGPLSIAASAKAAPPPESSVHISSLPLPAVETLYDPRDWPPALADDALVEPEQRGPVEDDSKPGLAPSDAVPGVESSSVAVAAGHSNGVTAGTSPQAVDVTQPESERALPEHLLSLDAFSRDLWIRGDGTTEAAPWKDASSFGEQLLADMERELELPEPSFGRLVLLAEAGDHLGVKTVPRRDLEDCARYWDGRASTTADDVRQALMYQSLTDGTAATSASRIRVLLEALRPAPARFATTRIDELTVALGLSSDLAAALGWMLALGSRHAEPLVEMRRVARQNDQPPVEDLRRKLVSARRSLKEVHDDLLAPGKWIKTTFCREAWQRFMEEIRQPVAALLSGKSATIEGLDDIEGIHRRIADESNARFEDRSRMDRRALELARTAERVRELVTAIDGAEHQNHHRSDLDPEPVLRILARPAVRGERFLHALVVRALSNRAEGAPGATLTITRDDVASAPDVLLGLARGIEDREDLAPDVFARPVVAAAALLARNSGGGDLHDALRRGAREALGTRVPWLVAPASRRGVEEAAAGVVDATEASLASLEQLMVRLDSAGSMAGQEIARARREAASTLSSGTRHPVEIRAWLSRLAEAAARLIAQEKATLLREAADRPEDVRAAVKDFLDQDRLDRASAIVRGEARIAIKEHPRACAWRDDAATRYRRPVVALREITDPRVKTGVERWFNRDATSQGSRARRTSFARIVLGDSYTAPERATNEVSVPMEFVLRALESRGFQPTFLPQLRAFARLVIPEVPLPSARTFVNDVAGIAGKLTQDLVVMLVPEAELEKRAELIKALRTRGAAVVVDDLDLCRILSPGSTPPDPLLALLEIALEQLDWQGSPFSRALVEGQLLLREMYVGRTGEAREIATTATYTRLFSGRMLGKSALLKFVEHTYHGAPLPSGNVLRVVYVPAVGVREERVLVQRIIDAASAKLEGFKDPDPGAASPAERLWAALANHLERKPKESVLLVLDEADTFVEAQIVEAQRRRESCLSFVMRSQMQGPSDARGLPRVRFVFTGYRSTHREEGAWANWGKALHLAPLPSEEAERLIKGPLARIGIDATDQAPVIAHRCGFQPAVLLAFGDRLLHRLSARVSRDVRTMRATHVTAEDVASVADEQNIHKEICRIARNNFDGNRAGLVLFGAVLAAFLEAGATAEIRDLAGKVGERVTAISKGVPAWLGADERAMTNAIERALSDLVQRQLLAERGTRDRRSHALVFPHHLRVLEPLAEENHLVTLVREIGSGDLVRAEEVGWLSLEQAVEIRELCRDQPSVPLLVPAVIALGADDVLPRPRFFRAVLDSLGFLADGVVDPEGALKHARYPVDCAVLGVDDGDLGTLLAHKRVAGRTPLLVGGATLWRVASSDASFDTAGGVAQVHAVPLARLPAGRVRWWLEVARGLTFVQGGDLLRIVEACAGIPFLVARADTHLVGADGARAGRQIGAEEVDALMHVLGSEIEAAARRITSSEPDWRISDRSLELFRMVAHIAKKQPDDAIILDDLCEELWSMHAAHGGAPVLDPFAMDSAADRLALDELQSLGLLPVTGSLAGRLPAERFDAVGPGDPVRKLCLVLAGESL